MRNAIACLALSALQLWALPLWASQNSPRVDQLAMAQVPTNPLMMLPGMRVLPSAGLPASGALPRPLISEVTNYPNPFDSRKSGAEGRTQIAYHLDQDAPVTVTLYDLMGFRVRRWQFSPGQNGGQSGTNTFPWDGTNESGQKVSKGGYLAQIEVDLPGAAVTVIRKIGLIH
jgi:hypothetical protein